MNAQQITRRLAGETDITGPRHSVRFSLAALAIYAVSLSAFAWMITR